MTTTLIQSTLADVQNFQRIAVSKGLTADLDCAPNYICVYFHDWSRNGVNGQTPHMTPFSLWNAETENECKEFLSKIEKFVSKWSPMVKA